MIAAGRKALITGGGSGIGLAIAKAYAGAGIEVTVAGRDCDKLAASGFRFVTMDVTDEASIADGVRECGRIDLFVANAGAAATAPALKTARGLWDDMLAVNLTSVYLCARAAVPAMVERGWGRFIVIASTAGLKGYPYAAAYAAAKHGAVGWVKTLALELAKSGVTANAICPGFTDTPLVDASVAALEKRTGRSRQETLGALLKDNPMGRLVAPEEVAAVALWLAGEGAASVNGQAIAIDGGETAS